MAPVSKPSATRGDEERGIPRCVVLHSIIFLVALVTVIASPFMVAIAIGIAVAMIVIQLLGRIDLVALVDAADLGASTHVGVAMAVTSDTASMGAVPIPPRSVEKHGAAQSGEQPQHQVSQSPPTS